MAIQSVCPRTRTQATAALSDSGCAYETELRQRGHSVVETDFLCDLAVLDAQHSGAREPHLPAGACRERTLKKVTEGRARVRAAADPPTDDIVAFGDKLRRTRETQVGERFTERRHERLHIRTAAARRVQRILQEDVGRGELVDDLRVPGITP